MFFARVNKIKDFSAERRGFFVDKAMKSSIHGMVYMFHAAKHIDCYMKHMFLDVERRNCSVIQALSKAS